MRQVPPVSSETLGTALTMAAEYGGNDITKALLEKAYEALKRAKAREKREEAKRKKAMDVIGRENKTDPFLINVPLLKVRAAQQAAETGSCCHQCW